MDYRKQVAEMRARMKTDEIYASFVAEQATSFRKTVTVPGIVQPQDITEWWHLTGRVSTAAVVYALTDDEYAGTWMHDSALWIARQSADAWIGPFFRDGFRTNPLKGTLETSHLANSVANALLFAPDRFTEEEREELRAALRDKGLPPLEEWLKPYYEFRPGIARSNWVIVELDGVYACAAVLDREDLMRKYMPLYADLHNDYNSEFYGEAPGYWEYACANFLSARFKFDMAFPHLIPEMPDINIILRPFLWHYYHRQGTFLLQNLDQTRFRGMNFGDQSTVGTALNHSILLYISIYGDDPQLRALVSAHLDKIFTAEGDHGSSLPVVCLFPFRGREHGDESFLPPTRLFTDGFMMYKDSWENPKIQIAMQHGVTEEPRLVAHRHGDQLSFQLAKDGIVILDDPGICCYRLHTSKLSQSPGWHSVPSFWTAGEKPRLIEQEKLSPKTLAEGRLNRGVYADVGEDRFAVISDASEIYPAPITSLKRTFAAVGENVLVIADTYTASEPVAEQMSFLGNNRRRAMKWVFNDDGATLTREGVGVRIRAMQGVSMIMDYAALHDATCSSPDSPMQGREGSGYLVRMKNKEAAAAGRSVYVVFADRAENLDNWNATLDGDTLTVTENGEVRCTFTLNDSPKAEI